MVDGTRLVHFNGRDRRREEEVGGGGGFTLIFFLFVTSLSLSLSLSLSFSLFSFVLFFFNTTRQVIRQKDDSCQFHYIDMAAGFLLAAIDLLHINIHLFLLLF